MAKQTLIPVHNEADGGFQGFCVGHNTELVAELQYLARGERRARVLYFWGEAGCGKTHLLTAACRLAGARQKPNIYLPMDGLPPDCARLQALADNSLVCVDDFHLVAACAQWQTAFFALYEKLNGGGGALVVAARQPLGAMQINLRDWASRLTAGGVYRVAPLNQRDKSIALQARARARGFELGEQTLNFILTYYPRDTASLFALLDRIDHASLAEQRKITIPFVKSLLQSRFL